jgi:nucleotide-binding universal stress UspA family protein
MKRVLAAIDDSAACTPVLAMAKTIARLAGASVEALHVVVRDAETARLAAASADVPLHECRGDPVDRIVASIDERQVTAAVLGSHAHGIRRGLGHVPLAVASRTSRPVVVVQPAWTPERGLRRLLVVVNGRAGAAGYVERAGAFVRDLGLPAVAVHVADDASLPSFDDQVQYETEEFANEFEKRYLAHLPGTTLELRVGRPADEIGAVVDECSADLVVIGWPDEPGSRREAVEEVLERGRVPTVVLRIPGDHAACA